ncbi:MAG: S26 family signal peptidase [Planctomycetota bacterium]
MLSRSRARLVILTVTAFVLIPAIAHRWGRTFRPKDRFQVTGNSMWPTLRHGDMCHVTPQRRLAVGDLVAIRWKGTRRVKRVAAVGGQRVELENGRLLVDGKRLEDHLAQTSDLRVPPARVAVETQPDSWVFSEDRKWLVYRHQNRHAGNRRTAIMDDYPINQSVKRQLHPVDHLVVELVGEPSLSKNQQEIIVEFFVANAVRRVRLRDRRASSRDAVQSNEASPLTAEQPIRIQWREGLDAGALAISREVEYRANPSIFTSAPYLLADNELFVVGDNIPVSVDSRVFGPISRHNVIGIVERVTSPSSPARP